MKAELVIFNYVANSIVIPVTVNGQKNVSMILDTGDAIGPVFNSQDAAWLKLEYSDPIAVSGAGGATTNYQTVADIAIGDIIWRREPAAIDPNLNGPSLIGLPFFSAHCSDLSIDFLNSRLVLIAEDI